MCVGFLYTVVLMALSGCDIIKVSKKVMDPFSLVVSVVNWICGCMHLRWLRNFSFKDVFMIRKVSSTYLFQIVEGCLADLMALISIPPCRGWPLWY